MKTFLSTLAITLAITFMAAPAEAGLTEGQKCAMKANLLSGKFSLCLNKADANVSKGRLLDTAAADAKCETKFRSGWDKTRTKAQEKDTDNGNVEMLGADCNGAMSDAVLDSVEASALIALGRDLTAFLVSDADLAEGSGVKAMVDEAVAEVDITSDNASLCTDAGGTYDAGTDTCSVDITSDNASLCTDAGGTYAAGPPETCTVDITTDNAALCTDAGGTYDAGADTCSVDITSDNAAAEQAGCVAAGGTYESSVCTPAPVPDRDCFREGACAYEGFNYGVYYNMYSYSRPTGCIKRPDAGPISADSYNDGVEAASPNRYSNITPWGVTVAWFCSQNVLAVPGTGQCAIGCD